MNSTIGQTLYFAYPCSVNVGIDPAEVVRETMLYFGQHPPEIRREIRTSLCRLCSCDDTISDDELVRKAEGLRGTRQWDYATAQDRTMMFQDVTMIEEYVENFLETAQFIRHGINNFPCCLKVINEVDDEHIGDLGGFLSTVQYTVKFLYLCGHGLSPSIASSLANSPADNETKRSAVWRWELRNCQKTMGKKPLEITTNAKAGDIVVFSSGLLTPEWVIHKIRDSESQRRHNTVIIVIDACFSGCWRNRIITELQKSRLRYARILIQTSCGDTEPSYGDLFTPLFCWLQHNGNVVMSENWHLFRQQSPTFFDSQGEQNNQPVVKHEFGGKDFYFFNDPRVFHNAVAFECSRRNVALERGIPQNEIYNFFNSIYINSPDKPTIVSCRLKTIENGTPMALFLVEWHEKFYHLHIHFYDFGCMEISGVTHVNVTKQSDIYRLHFTETELKDKEYIGHYSHVWQLIDNEKFANYCKKFMEEQKVNWTKRSSWNMEDTKPSGMIRSRCATLEITLLAYILKNS